MERESELLHFSVDDVVFTFGKNSDPFTENLCDFETPAYCGFDVTIPKGVAWAWRNGRDTIAIGDGGPITDKSQNSQYGTCSSLLKA